MIEVRFAWVSGDDPRDLARDGELLARHLVGALDLVELDMAGQVDHAAGGVRGEHDPAAGDDLGVRRLDVDEGGDDEVLPDPVVGVGLVDPRGDVRVVVAEQVRVGRVVPEERRRAGAARGPRRPACGQRAAPSGSAHSTRVRPASASAVTRRRTRTAQAALGVDGDALGADDQDGVAGVEAGRGAREPEAGVALRRGPGPRRAHRDGVPLGPRRGGGRRSRRPAASRPGRERSGRGCRRGW